MKKILSSVLTLALIVPVSFVPTTLFAVAGGNGGGGGNSPVYEITINEPIVPTGTSINLSGNANATHYTGQEGDQHVGIWWDSTDINDKLPDQDIPVDGDAFSGNDFDFDWSYSHDYLTSGTHTITVKVCHQICKGAEGDGAATDTTVVVIPPPDNDADDDGILDDNDNCPSIANPNQEDTDGDGMGDVCDPDIDNDGVVNGSDNCVYTANTDQADTDGDGAGDVCDNDIDGDGVTNGSDNCVSTPNPGQDDLDGDNIGDVCDNDKDGDGVLNDSDNCPIVPNQDQIDSDSDGIGDACDDTPFPDTDEDGVVDPDDNCLTTPNSDQADQDEDGIGDVCDNDIDGDEVINETDNCDYVQNPGQEDLDGDGVGDVCDNDKDGDGVENETDNCPVNANPNQADQDEDGIGDVCDNDIDGDEVTNEEDNCPVNTNPDQLDSDSDGEGDVCDDTPLPPNPQDTTPPVSIFNESRNHVTIDTEILALSLTGNSDDSASGVVSGVASANISIYKVAGENSLTGEAFETLSCDRNSEVPIELVALNLVSTNPITLSGNSGDANRDWNYAWSQSGRGVYCLVVHATDVAGNVENTAVAGPIAYTFTPPVPPTPPTPPAPPSGGGGGGGNGPIVGSFGQVLGAYTTAGEVLGASCGLYMNKHVRLGSKKNDAEQVRKLQEFLNAHMGSNLPMTGFYGPMTYGVVKEFQAKYGDEILKPWGLTTATGLVYLSTLRQINNIECPDIMAELPPLIPWSQNPNAQ